MPHQYARWIASRQCPSADAERAASSHAGHGRSDGTAGGGWNAGSSAARCWICRMTHTKTTTTAIRLRP